MKRFLSILALTVLTISLLIMNLTGVGANGAFSKTYTLDADFDQGVLFNVNHSPNHDQLQLNAVSNPYPVMWIANAGEDTLSKWNTSTNKEIARYHTWFDTSNHGAWTGAAPSRTAVDKDGNAYVANRHLEDNRKAEVFKILTDSFIDRNGNGVVDTCVDTDNDGIISAAELLPFQMADNNPANGIIDQAEIKDERIAWVVQVGPNNGIGRSLSIDPNGFIWLGLWTTDQYYKLSPVDGSIVAGPIAVANLNGGHPYGSLVDKYGILWGINWQGGSLLKLNTNTNTVVNTFLPANSGWRQNYGIALAYDPGDGHTIVYMSNTQGNKYVKFDSVSETFSAPGQGPGFNSYGIGTDTAGNIYCSGHPTGALTKFAPDGSVLWTKPSQFASSDTRAAVVDADGNAWVVLLGSSKLEKFQGSDGSPLGVFNSGLLPYTYSDATGISLISSILPQGTFTVNTDGGAANPGWTNVSWNALAPAGTSVTVRVRSSTDQNAWSAWENVTNGGPITTTPDQRYLQVEALLKITSGTTSPILYDLTVNATTVPTTIPTTNPEVGGDIYPVSKVALLTPWIASAIILVAGAAILIWRRRAQS
jgi:streptogramin lyase